MLSAHVMLIRVILSDPSPGFFVWSQHGLITRSFQQFYNPYLYLITLIPLIWVFLKAIVLTVTTNQAFYNTNGGDSIVGKNCISAILSCKHNPNDCEMPVYTIMPSLD